MRTVVIRNSIYNLLGLGLPVVVAVVTIPELIRSLGVDQFGILTLIWAVVSYFGLFDLGLGRAVTQQVASTLAQDDAERLRAIVGTSTLLMLLLGILGGLILALGSFPLARQLAGANNAASTTNAFLWMALAMPAIVLTSGYRGILEAVGDFKLVNAIRLPMGVFTYAGPLIVVWAGYASLPAIAAVLCFGRVVAAVLHGFFAIRALPPGIGNGRLDRTVLRPLLGMGGWMTVSNIVSPLMSYTDRFLLGALVSAEAVALYATPQELVLRLGIIPTAVAAVLFPIFSAHDSPTGTADLKKHLWQYSLLILALLLPFTLALVTLAEPLLAAWINPSFARGATLPLQIMAIAALCSGLAQVPFAMLQGRGRADLTAKLHLVELPIYLAVLYGLIIEFGLAGAACAWLMRIMFDMVVLYWMCHRFLAEEQLPLAKAGAA